MPTFNNTESGASVRSKINAAITTVDSLGGGDNLLLTAIERVVLSYTMGQSHVRHVEFWGAVAVGFFETPVDNLAAIQAAVDWSSTSGGTVLFGGGIYGHDGSIAFRSFPRLMGTSKGGSWLQQLSATPSTSFHSLDGAGQSIYGVHMTGLRIQGNWNVNFNQDNSADHEVPLVYIRGSLNGPDDPVALNWFGVAGLADPHHIIEDCEFYGSHGDAIRLEGRGEMRIRYNKIWRCARHGILCTSPDNWITSNTIFAVGDCGIIVDGGNTRVIDNKTWFCGQTSFMEVEGHGIYFRGAGRRNNSAVNHHSQDCFGAGVKIEHNIKFNGVIDECGGGRLSQQGNGWQGTRTEPRCFIELAGATGSEVNVMVSGGNLVLDGQDPPQPILGDLVYISGSGSRNNTINIHTDRVFYDEAVNSTNGYRNANRHNIIVVDGQLVEGWRTPAELLDPTHGINTDSFHSTVLTYDATAGIRNMSIRQDDNTWRAFGNVSSDPVSVDETAVINMVVIERAAYEDVGFVPDEDTLYFVKAV